MPKEIQYLYSFQYWKLTYKNVTDFECYASVDRLSPPDTAGNKHVYENTPRIYKDL